MHVDSHIDLQQEFFDTLAKLEIDRANLSLTDHEQKKLKAGYIGVQDFKNAYARICAYAALQGRVVIVVAGKQKQPALVIAPESQIILPQDSFIHNGINNPNSKAFISLSLPEPFAYQYRTGRNQTGNRDKNVEYAEKAHDGKLLGPGVYWRQHFEGDRAAIVAQFGTAQIRSNAPKPN